jgi:hypothetical protein
MDRCLEAHPPLFDIDDHDHEAACYLYESDPSAEIQEEVS